MDGITAFLQGWGVSAKPQAEGERRGIGYGSIVRMQTATKGVAFEGVVTKIMYRADRRRDQHGNLIIDRVQVRNRNICITVSPEALEVIG